ncbi:MAG: hypothetical protein U0326_34775 [Polyangiales bacterium]
MLTRVYIDNYWCFTNFEWSPKKLVLIAGRNGSGKSALLDVLGAVRELVLNPGPALPAVFSSSERTRWDDRTTQRVELDFAADGYRHHYELTVDHADPQKPRIASESLTVDGQVVYLYKDGAATLSQGDGSAAPSAFRSNKVQSFLGLLDTGNDARLTSFLKALSNLWYVAPDPRSVDPYSTSEDGFIEPSMSNFVSWYRTVQADPLRARRIDAALAEIFPGFVGLGLQPPMGKQKRLVASFAQDLRRRDEKTLTLDFQELSDGQRMLVMLYTLLEVVPFDQGATLIIDEPDNYLALAEVQPWVRSLEDRVDEGPGQAFILSHHPEVLNRFWPSLAVHFERDLFGPTRVKQPVHDNELQPAEVWARSEESCP